MSFYSQFTWRKRCVVVILIALIFVGWHYQANGCDVCAQLAALVSSSDSVSVSLDKSEANSALLPASRDNVKSLVSIKSDDSLDPIEGRAFVVNFDVLFDELPAAGKQEKIISKYESAKAPYPGWSIALRNFGTSMRPEVYWQSPKGKGGWHIFEEVFLEKGKWYSFTLVSEKNALSLFLQKAFWRQSASDSQEETQAKEQSPKEYPSSPVMFLGGYEIPENVLPLSGDALDIKFRPIAGSRYPVHVASVLIARTATLPGSLDRVEKIISGGAVHLAKFLPAEDLSLWLREDGRDHSRFSRSLPVLRPD